VNASSSSSGSTPEALVQAVSDSYWLNQQVSDRRFIGGFGGSYVLFTGVAIYENKHGMIVTSLVMFHIRSTTIALTTFEYSLHLQLMDINKASRCDTGASNVRRKRWNLPDNRIDWVYRLSSDTDASPFPLLTFIHW